MQSLTNADKQLWQCIATMVGLATHIQCQLSKILWHKCIGKCGTTHVARRCVCS